MENTAEKPHGGDCTCRVCDAKAALDQQADRVGAYRTALALLKEVPALSDNPHTPHEHLVLANWIVYGGSNGDDD